ncbi:MAG: hypothetical protein ABI349_13240 [Casimicrobiaceae bacterium]
MAPPIRAARIAWSATNTTVNPKASTALAAIVAPCQKQQGCRAAHQRLAERAHRGDRGERAQQRRVRQPAIT